MNKMFVKKSSVYIFSCLALIALLSCARPSLAKEQAAFDTYSFASEHRIGLESVDFDDKWNAGLLGGFIGGGSFGPPPRTAGSSDLGPTPAPRTMFARWFDFERQRFFEASLNDPDLPKKFAAVKAKQPKGPKYRYIMVISFGGKGEVQLWLEGTDSARDSDDWRFIEFITSTQGHYAEGDPARYKQYTDSWRKKGRLSQEPLKD